MQQIRQLPCINGFVMGLQQPPFIYLQGYVNSWRDPGNINHIIALVDFESPASYKYFIQLLFSKPRLQPIAKALPDTWWIAKGSNDHRAVAMKPNFYESSLTH
jgi:hypothetical protein